MEFPGSMHGHRVLSLWVCIFGVFFAMGRRLWWVGVEW